MRRLGIPTTSAITGCLAALTALTGAILAPATAMEAPIEVAAVTVVNPTEVDLSSVPQAQGCELRPGSTALEDLGGSRFLITPEDYMLGVDQLLLYAQCEDGSNSTLAIRLNIPFYIRTPDVISPSQSAGMVRSIWVRSKEPAVAQVLRNGKVVKTSKIPTGGGVVKSPIKANNASGDWRVRVSSGGQIAERRLDVAKGWAPLSDTVEHFPRCSTLTWSLDPKGQPARAKGIEKDIKGTLSRLSKATGLTFIQTNDLKAADLRYSWGSANGHAGLGGYSYSRSSEGNHTMYGTVEMSKSSAWLGIPGFGSAPGRTPGRGALLLHETMHALGLGHVADSKQIMNPVSAPGAPAELQAGDKAGLKWLYAPATCTA